MTTVTPQKKGTRRSWNWRSLVSFQLLFAAIALLASGVVLFISPPGRFAHPTDWQLLGFDKGQWEAIHTLTGYVSAFFAVFHLVLNWNAICHYLRDRVQRTYRPKPEFIAALLITVIVLIGSVYNIPPFGTVMDWGEGIKESWSENIQESWEQQTVLPGTSTEEQDVVTPMEDETAFPDTSVEEQAAIEPAEDETAPPDTTVEEQAAGGPTGKWGQFTVEELCTQQGIPVADGLAHLAAYGLEANSTTRIRTLSDSSIYPPSDVANIILGLEPGE